MGPLLGVLPDCRQMSAGAAFHVRLSWGGTHFQALHILGRIHLVATVGLRSHSLPGKRSLPSGPHRVPTVWQLLQGQQGQTEVECHLTACHRSDIPSPLHISWFPSTLKGFMLLFVVLKILIKVNWRWARFTQQSRGLLPRKLSATFVSKHFPLLNLLKFLFFTKRVFKLQRRGI